MNKSKKKETLMNREMGKEGSQKLCDYKFLQTQKGISSSPWLPSFDIIDLSTVEEAQFFYSRFRLLLFMWSLGGKIDAIELQFSRPNGEKRRLYWWSCPSSW